MPSPLDDAIGLDTTFDTRFGNWGAADLRSPLQPGTTKSYSFPTYPNPINPSAPQTAQPPDFFLRGKGDGTVPNLPSPDTSMETSILRTTIGVGSGGITLDTQPGGATGNFLVRAGVIILGFVFVAVGLSKFGGEQVASVVRRASPL